MTAQFKPLQFKDNIMKVVEDYLVCFKDSIPNADAELIQSITKDLEYAKVICEDTFNQTTEAAVLAVFDRIQYARIKQDSTKDYLLEHLDDTTEYE